MHSLWDALDQPVLRIGVGRCIRWSVSIWRKGGVSDHVRSAKPTISEIDISKARTAHNDAASVADDHRHTITTNDTGKM